MKPYQYWHKRINVPAATGALAGIGINVTEIGRFVDKTVYRGADKSLVRPGRKRATATEDFEFHISYL
jgi:hypothetical protein